MAAVELSAPKHLGRTVVLGYCDIAAAGIRALEGLSPTASGATATGMRETGRESLTFLGMGDAVFDGFPPLEAVHFNGDGGPDSNGSVTLLKLNTVVGLDLSASLAMSMVDLLAAHQPALERVIIAAAVQPPKRHEMPKPAPAPSSTTPTTSTVMPPDAVCAFSCASEQCDNDGSVREDATKPLPTLVSSLAVLPSGARIADSFLTTLARLCQLEDLPLLVLARLGYRSTGAAADVDGTDEAINGLGVCLAKVLDLEFNTERACGARKSRGWKGTDPARGVVPGYI